MADTDGSHCLFFGISTGNAADTVVYLFCLEEYAYLQATKIDHRVRRVPADIPKNKQ